MTQRWRAPVAIGVLGAGSTLLVMYLAGRPGFSSSALVVIIGVLGAVATLLGVVAVLGLALRERALTRDVEQRTAELQTLVRRAPDATLLVDADGTIRFASDRILPLLGHRPDDLVGQPVELLIPDEVRDIHRSHRSAYFHQDPTAREMGPDRELRAQHREGYDIAVEISLNPMPANDDGRIQQVVVSLRDATIRHEARRQLHESISQKNAFMRTVSHELRTPLTAIAGFTDLLETSWDTFDDRTKREFLGRIGRNAMGLHALIEEILEYSRLERGKVRVEPTELDLTKVVRRVVEQLGVVLDDHHVAIDAPTDDVTVLADEQATGRVLTNLLVNAARYSPDGTTITVSVADTDPAQLIVDDEGPGIPVSERRLVFEQFWRGNHSHVIEQTGTGIGLAVVRQLTEMMHGTVDVDDAPTGGARLVVSLPRPST